MAERYLDIVEDISSRLDIPLQTPEFEIASALLDIPKATPKDLMGFSRLSSAGFSNSLRRMTAEGLLHCEACPDDKRSKLYYLDSEIKRLIFEQLLWYKSSSIKAFSSIGMPRSALVNEPNYVSRSMPIKHMTCDGQIILYLYLKPGVANLEFVDSVDVSTTTFNDRLSRLTRMNHIYFQKDASDRRKKRYFLTADVYKLLDEMHKRVFAWLDSLECATQ